MSKYQLTLSPTYVSDWNYVDAIRELFQNALDNQTENPANEMFYDYNDGVLRIGNKTSILTVESLLLGMTSKKDNENTIGKHGEGYKVAIMVLLREGKEVTIYNYGAREIWTTRLVKSRRFNGALITEINIQKKAFFSSVPHHDLIIEINGINKYEYSKIVESNLHMQEDYKEYKSEGIGSVLLDERHRGKIFINGLYVTSNNEIRYGYNVHPSHLSLDRDRKLVDTFNLLWTASKIWRYSGQDKEISRLLIEGVSDVKYLKSSRTPFRDSYTSERDIDNEIKTRLKEDWKEMYGDNAVPVSTNEELEKIQRYASIDITPVITSSAVVEYLEDELELPEEVKMTSKERLQEWFKKVEHKMTDEEKDDFNIILDELIEYPF